MRPNNLKQFGLKSKSRLILPEKPLMPVYLILHHKPKIKHKTFKGVYLEVTLLTLGHIYPHHGSKGEEDGGGGVVGWVDQQNKFTFEY